MTPRGGSRKGAGRKPLGDKARAIVAVTLPPELAEWASLEADAQGLSRSELITRSLEALRTGQLEGARASVELDRYDALLAELEVASRNTTPASSLRALGLSPDAEPTIGRLLRLGLVALRHLEGRAREI